MKTEKWLAVDVNGKEYEYDSKPYRLTDTWINDGDCNELPAGAIKELTGKDLTWDNEPIEVK